MRERELIRRCWQGLARRGKIRDPRYRRQLRHELQVILSLKFANYFLIVADLVAWARSQGIPVGPGRGSAAGSLVAWALEITDPDPIQYRLYFERFLNPARVSPPDIDLDFSRRRREEVVQYLRQRYGEDRVVQICTYARMLARQAIRDVARVLELPYTEADRLAKLIPPPLQGKPLTYSQALELVPELARLYREGHPVLTLIHWLEGLEKALSVHAAGVVVADQPLDECLPLAISKGTVVTQWDMRDLDALGFVKFDLLALKNLDVIDDCVRLVRERHGREIDWRHLPLEEDPQVFEFLRQGRYAGIFQLEGTSGMRELILEMQPRSIEDLAAAIALFRPGPLGAGMKEGYIQVRHGQQSPNYLVPELEEILAVTNGQLIYQEQVLEICRRLAGYSLAEADLMRRAIGKKIVAEMEAQRQRFLEGMQARHYPREVAEELFRQIETHAGYGFNKAHAVAYAWITYQTAWLKAYYPQEFYVALLNQTTEPNEREKFISYLQELRQVNIPLLPPDLNRSQLEFILEGNAIRYGLLGLKQVSQGELEALLAIRPATGFSSFRQLLESLPPGAVNAKTLEALTLAGALDSLGPREQLARTGPEALQQWRKYQKGLESLERQYQRELDRIAQLAQLKPKEHGGEKAKCKEERLAQRMEEKLRRLEADYEAFWQAKEQPVSSWSLAERQRWEWDLLGVYLSQHPAHGWAERLAAQGVIPLSRLATLAQGKVQVVGVVSRRRDGLTRQKRRFCYLTLEDEEATVEVACFSRFLEQLERLPEEGQLIWVTGQLRREGEGLRLVAEEVKFLEPLSAVLSSSFPPLRLLAYPESLNPDALQQLKEALLRQPGPHPVQLLTRHQSLLLCWDLALSVTLPLDPRSLPEGVTIYHEPFPGPSGSAPAASPSSGFPGVAATG